MADDIFKAVVEWDMPNGSVGQNVLYAQVIGGDAADVEDLVADIVATIVSRLGSWITYLATEFLLDAIKVYAFDASTGVSVPLGAGNPNVTGGDGAATLPLGCCVKLSWYAPQRARPAGIYLPAPTVTHVDDDGSLGVGATAAALATANALKTTGTLIVTGLTYRPVYWAKGDGLMVTINPATSAVNDVIDYQRRRKAGVGI